MPPWCTSASIRCHLRAMINADRLRGAALPDRRPARAGHDGGVPAPGVGDAAGEREAGRHRHPQRAVRARGTTPTWASCRRGSTPARSTPGGCRRSSSSRTSPILIWEAGWYNTHQFWPTSHNTLVFEGNVYSLPAKSASERVGREMAAVSFKEYSLQDANTLEATQLGLESRVIDQLAPERPGGAGPATSTRSRPTWVHDYQREQRGVTEMALLPSEFAELEPFADDVVPGDRARALGGADVELHGRPAGVLRRHPPPGRRGDRLLRQVPLDDMPDDAVNLLRLVYSFVIVSFPVELWAPAVCPRHPRHGRSTGISEPLP